MRLHTRVGSRFMPSSQINTRPPFSINTHIAMFCIQWRIWLKWFLSLLVQKTHFFLYGPTPRSSKFAMETFMKFDWHYSVKQWLTLHWYICQCLGTFNSSGTLIYFWVLLIQSVHLWRHRVSNMEQMNRYFDIFWGTFNSVCVFMSLVLED